jgi:hypothetical protein
VVAPGRDLVTSITLGDTMTLIVFGMEIELNFETNNETVAS